MIGYKINKSLGVLSVEPCWSWDWHNVTLTKSLHNDSVWPEWYDIPYCVHLVYVTGYYVITIACVKEIVGKWLKR